MLKSKFIIPIRGFPGVNINAIVQAYVLQLFNMLGAPFFGNVNARLTHSRSEIDPNQVFPTLI